MALPSPELHNGFGVTPDMITNLGYKVFFTFASVNIGAMAVFSLMIPETKGRSLEDMDVIFGSVSVEERNRHIDQQEDANDKAAEISESIISHHTSKEHDKSVSDAV
ncbi:hypothetical protein CYLTODRAFT_460265 [Cylindrobasidium torrendii FP15055 ss-10]|uniref:Major facilitator superfamily (MFS) profile domain-containing protein n=1 Tax=Cylindrobasidium torrendii FP15055 ss-10 TaxID=1314674 RepID=A0A0D7ARV7_9AGAR|nr:hypothetical protein CYLTODRAFT_460265 [Cylindrobasidium torrendii FP15055 ss-10]